MPIIGLTTFRGLVPKLEPRRLAAEQAQTAENSNLLPHILEPFYRPLATYSLDDSLQRSIFLWRYSDTSMWLSWEEDVDVVKGPLADDDKDRIYYTDGVTYPRIKGWTGSEVSDRTCYMPSPDKITVAKSWLFDPSVVTCQYRDSAGTVNTSLTDIERKEDRLYLTFDMPSHVAGEGVWQYRLTIPGVGSTPNETSDPNYVIYEDTLELDDDAGVKYGEFQVIGRDYINYDWDADVQSGWTIPFAVKFTIKMNYERSTTQYLYYVSTFVDDWGMEGPPSDFTEDNVRNNLPVYTSRMHDNDDVSTIIEWAPGEKLTLTLNGATPGGYNIEKRRIYRSAAGTNEDAFFYLDEVDENVSTYVDTKSDAALAEPMPLFQNPPTGLTGLIVMPGGFTAAFLGKELYMSPPYMPHSYPDEYRLTFAYDIVAIASSGNDIVVMTKGNPYYVTGSHPEVMTQTELMINQSCVSKRGVAAVGGLVLYPSPDGVVAVQNGSAKLISETFYNPKDWRTLTPSSAISSAHDKKLFMFFTDTALIWDFDQADMALVTTDETVLGLYTDLEDDALYMIQGAEITEWEGSSLYLTATWKSKEFQLKMPMEFNSGRVESTDYTNCVLRLYSKGTEDNSPVLVTTVNVIDGKAFRIPIRRPERVWSIEIENDAPVTEMMVSTSMDLIRRT